MREKIKIKAYFSGIDRSPCEAANRKADDAVNEVSDNIDENSAAPIGSIGVTIEPEPRSKLEQQSAHIQLENQQLTVDIIN
ncbi:hypothetical protein WA026_012336 [Henosepilachna vigintioctopunctata]|uniref:Uncharacterized protein n=1 Tax=Henosepilachna vigintioctopunctata TaxID=420089 RepID=A0AAW1UXF6_9CUCU